MLHSNLIGVDGREDLALEIPQQQVDVRMDGEDEFARRSHVDGDDVGFAYPK